MLDLTYRPRRLRTTPAMRALVRETTLQVEDLIYPLFIVPGTGVKEELHRYRDNTICPWMKR